MKKRLLFMFFILCIIAFSGVGAMASTYKTEVKVGIKYGSSAGSSVKVSSGSGLNVYDAVTGNILYQALAGEEVNISMWANGFASANKFDASGIYKISVQVPGGGIISCDGQRYRGYIYIEKTSGGELLVINYVGTDDYVTSVLGKEMSYSWPLEALKAQAICARNFVLCRGSAHKNYGFDVCTTVHCQVYGGVASEHENTRRAVNETKGKLVYYNGNIVPLYFFATSGGQTEDVKNVWGSEIGYLKSVPDTYENPEKASRYRWSATLTRQEIESKLKANGMNIGTLKSISIDSQTSSGRVTQMTFHGTAGSQSVKREKCRTIFGFYSQKFDVQADSVSQLITAYGEAKAPLYALSADGISGVAGYSVLSESGLSTINVSGAGYAEKYNFSGGGYGHGVGMSQWGARGMAENGFTYDKILHHYFTGIELR